MWRRFKKHAAIITFLAIIALAAILRLYRLDSVPPGVNRDEASIGYTAYSLLKTGKDEYGRFLPLSFQSFGDWKLPLYIYLTVPLVKIFGVTEIAVRLTSAVAGILTVGLTFFLVKLLFNSAPLAFLSMAVTAVAPWDVHLSRVESESNVAVFLVALGVYLFFKADKKRGWLYLVGFALWGLTYFTYAGNHVFTTLLVFGIIVLFYKTIFSNQFAKFGLGLFVIIATIILSQTLLGADRTKISGISIFATPFVVYKNIELPRWEHNNPGNLPSAFFHNRIIYALEIMAEHYEESFSPQFLAVSGGTNHAHNIQNFGNIYLIEYPLLILGLATLLAKLKDPKMKLVLWWILISPVAATITSDAPHTNRMASVLPILSIISALGIYWLLMQFKTRKQILFGLITTIFIAYLINFSIYLDRYYVHFPRNEAQYWGIWYKELAQVLNSNRYQNDQVIMANTDQSPYIFLLFYTNYNPAIYQKLVERYPPTTDGFINVKSFGRFNFKPINWSKDVGGKHTVLVDYFENIPTTYQKSVVKIGGFGLYNVQ